MDAKSLAEQATQEYTKGELVAAAGFFAQAAQAYSSAQDELNAAEMKNNQSVALLKAGKAREALSATDGTEAVFQKAGDLKRQGIAIAKLITSSRDLPAFSVRLMPNCCFNSSSY